MHNARHLAADNYEGEVRRLAKEVGRYLGDETVGLLDNGDLSYDKTMGAIAVEVHGQMRIISHALAVLWDSGARPGPRNRKNKRALKYSRLGFLRERQCQVHNTMEPELFDKVARAVEALREQGVEVCERAFEELRSGSISCTGVGGTAEIKEIRVLNGLRLALMDYDTGAIRYTPEFQWFRMHAACSFEAMLGHRPLRMLGGVCVEEVDAPCYTCRAMCDETGAEIKKPTRVSNWVYYRDEPLKVTAAHPARSIETLTAEQVAQLRPTACKLVYAVKLPSEAGSLVQVMLPAKVKHKLMIGRTPPVFIVDHKHEVAAPLNTKRRDAVRFPKEVVLTVRLCQAESSILSRTAKLMDTLRAQTTQDDEAELHAIDGSEVQATTAHASKYKQKSLRMSWDDDAFSEVLKEDAQHRAQQPPAREGNEWREVVYAGHWKTTDKTLVSATAKLHDVPTEQMIEVVDQCYQAIAVNYATRFHAVGHKLTRMAMEPIGAEVIKAEMVPAVQRQKLDVSSKSGRQTLVENILFSHEIHDGTAIDVTADQTWRTAIAVCARGMWAIRAKCRRGRIVWDFRVLNLITCMVSALLTSAEVVHGYLRTAGMGFQSHDVAGAFRNVPLKRNFRPFAGVLVGSHLGVCPVGALGMRAIGNAWTQMAYPRFAQLQVGPRCRAAFLRAVFEAVTEGRRLGTSIRLGQSVAPTVAQAEGTNESENGNNEGASDREQKKEEGTKADTGVSVTGKEEKDAVEKADV